ncbi:F-box protein At1g49360-like [Fagus crenata]
MDSLLITQKEEYKFIDKNSIVVSPTKTPLLFFLGEFSGETKHGFFDPISQTFTITHLQELECQAECLASRFGWLLILSRSTSSLFFFNPITRQRINLPYRNRFINAATFSAPPNSPGCTVFAIETSSFITQFHIDTFVMGGLGWTSHEYSFSTNKFSNVVQAVCSNGVLHCVDSSGRIGTFDVKFGTWRIIPSHKFDRVCTPYLVEFKGKIFAAKKGASGVIEKIYKLKLRSGVATWEEEELGDVSLFLGPFGSCGLWALDGIMNKKLFVSDYGPKSKCVIYNVDGRDYKKAKTFSVNSFSWCYTPVWIER